MVDADDPEGSCRSSRRCVQPAQVDRIDGVVADGRTSRLARVTPAAAASAFAALAGPCGARGPCAALLVHVPGCPERIPGVSGERLSREIFWMGPACLGAGK